MKGRTWKGIGRISCRRWAGGLSVCIWRFVNVCVCAYVGEGNSEWFRARDVWAAEWRSVVQKQQSALTFLSGFSRLHPLSRWLTAGTGVNGLWVCDSGRVCVYVNVFVSNFSSHFPQFLYYYLPLVTKWEALNSTLDWSAPPLLMEYRSAPIAFI